MDREYKSKVGWLYHLIVLIMAGCTVRTFIHGTPVAMVTLLLATLLCIHVLLTTWYRITADGYLIAHCSIFPEKKIKIEEISAIEATVLPVSSYALSMDRLIIYKGEAQWLLISPTNKKEFVRHLRKINPDIQIKDPLIS